MMPAAKHGDPQLGVDIHMCAVPPSPSPVPLPTPHTSIVFDPFDYVPFLGATVSVCGMKRATAGTNATAIHIPPGFPLVPVPKIPEKDDEIFMGSATVNADGDPMSFVAVPVLSCQVAGMISPFRIKKSGPPKAMILPTTVNLAIPTNVFVGGPPTISLMGMAFKGLFSALGKFVKSGVFKRMRQRMFKSLNPGFFKCVILRAEPVNILTGDVSVEQQDFVLPGRIPIEWMRSYSSGNRRNGLCGHGWETPADIRLEIDASNGSVLMIHPSIGPLLFEHLPATLGETAAELELMDGALLSDHGSEFRVRTKEDRIYCFSKMLKQVNVDGATEYAITRITDLCGNWLEFERRGTKLVGIAESEGRRIVLESDSGRITEITLHLPNTEARHVFARYQYDAVGDLVSVVDALDQPYTFGYDAHHMVRHTDRNGLSFYYEYDKVPADAWRVKHAWGDGGLYDYRFEYFDVINERRITDSLGHVSIVKLDECGLPINEIDPLGGMTTYEYDDAGRTTAVVDPDSHRTLYVYDERGNLLSLTRPDGKTIVAEFNASNKATSVTDPNGALWQQVWNTRGLLTQQITPLGAESTYEYDTHGQLVGFTNPLKARTVLAFDVLGNLTRLTDALGHATDFAYDVRGNVTSKTDPLRQTTRYAYDAKNRLTQAVLPSGASIACAYDHEDNLACYTDENGAETRLEYFGQGEIKRRIQPDGHAVEYLYDTEERLIGVTNQRGEIYRLRRDPLGRIVEEVDYWKQSRRYAYTAAGYLTQSIDPLERVINYKTDKLGRIIKKSLIDADGAVAGNETFAYDPNGNLVYAQNAATKIERAFDGEGRLVEEKQGAEFVIRNKYDLNGNRREREINLARTADTYSSTVRYGYDLRDQAVSVQLGESAPIQLTRNALGQVTTEQLSPALRRELAYTDDGYLKHQRMTQQSGALYDIAYDYDPAGNLLEKRDSLYGVDRYTYDPIGRLTEHLDPQLKLTQYFNDPAGDRLRTRINASAAGSKDNATAWTRDGEYRGSYYRFDRSGNLVERKEPSKNCAFTWDGNQRLIESTTNEQITNYLYDPLGRRVTKTTGSNQARFYWDGDALVMDDITGNDPSTAHQTRQWIYYPETFEPLAMERVSSVERFDIYLYQNDPNGCPTRMLDVSGEVVWAAQYSAWGGVERLHVDRVDNPIRLQGQYRDAETGMYYNRHRYYEPLIGQFASQDILRLVAGPNTYRFAPNTTGWIDPVGLVCLDRRVGRFRDPATGRFVAGTRVRGHFPNNVTPGQRILYRADPVTGQITHFQHYDAAGLPLKRVDITGATHGGVPTPHVVEFTQNVNPHTGQVFPRQNRMVRPAGPQDLL